jgi:hypothetical protein
MHFSRWSWRVRAHSMLQVRAMIADIVSTCVVKELAKEDEILRLMKAVGSISTCHQMRRL